MLARPDRAGGLVGDTWCRIVEFLLPPFYFISSQQGWFPRKVPPESGVSRDSVILLRYVAVKLVLAAVKKIRLTGIRGQQNLRVEGIRNNSLLWEPLP